MGMKHLPLKGASKNTTIRGFTQTHKPNISVRLIASDIYNALHRMAIGQAISWILVRNAGKIHEAHT